MSEYFTIQNPEDGGLNTTVKCPTGAPNITNTNAPTSTNTPADAQESQDSPSGEKSPPVEDSPSSGYSAAVLGGAIAGVAAFFIILLAAVFFIGRKQGWIVFGRRRNNGGYEAARYAETDIKEETPAPYSQSPITTPQVGTKAPSMEQSFVGAGDNEINEYMRLYRKYGDIQFLGGNQVHQMSGNPDGS